MHVSVTCLIHAAGVSPSQASPEMILRVDLYGTAIALQEFGNTIARGGAGVVIASRVAVPRPLRHKDSRTGPTSTSAQAQSRFSSSGSLVLQRTSQVSIRFTIGVPSLRFDCGPMPSCPESYPPSGIQQGCKAGPT